MNCTGVIDGDLAGDGSMETAAVVQPGGQGTLWVKGGRRKAGTVAGAYLVMPSSGSVTVNFTTSLDGQPQESGGYSVRAPGSNACGGFCLSDGEGEYFFGFVTSSDYNYVQASISNTGSSTVYIHELCTRPNADLP